MLNIDNFGLAEGRATSDPVVFDNKDGSKKVRITLAIPNNYKNRDGSRSSEFIPFESFIPAGRANEGVGIFQNIGKGDLLKVEYSLKNNDYTDAAGNKVYGIVCMIDSLKMVEPKTVTDARHAANATAAAEAEAPDAVDAVAE